MPRWPPASQLGDVSANLVSAFSAFVVIIHHMLCVEHHLTFERWRTAREDVFGSCCTEAAAGGIIRISLRRIWWRLIDPWKFRGRFGCDRGLRFGKVGI